MTTWDRFVALTSREEPGVGQVLQHHVARSKHGGMELSRDGDTLTITLESAFDLYALKPYEGLLLECVRQLRPDITAVRLTSREV